MKTPPKDLKGKWALVTGASSGIGEQFAMELGYLQMNVIIVSNQPDGLKKVAEDVEYECGVTVHTLDIDLGSHDAVGRIMDFLDANSIEVTFLINNAGIFNFCPVSKLSDSRINLYIDLHMRTVTLLCSTIAQRMVKAGGGYILNMSSMSCWMPMPGIALYSSTKAYIRAFSRAIRIELKDYGVNVTTACPGGIATNLFGLKDNLKKLGVRLGVLVTPEKFAHRAIKKTLKGKAQYINGFINRLAIVFVASFPEWFRLKASRYIFNRMK